MGSLMLLDTASLYFRAFYGVPETVAAPDGTPVNAIRGLLDMVTRLVRARHPERLVACLDADWRPAFRVAALPSSRRTGPVPTVSRKRSRRRSPRKCRSSSRSSPPPGWRWPGRPVTRRTT